jgi:hypothetical protein
MYFFFGTSLLSSLISLSCHFYPEQNIIFVQRIVPNSLLNMIMKRKFKQWWSTILPILTKRTITSHLNSLSTNHIVLYYTLHFYFPYLSLLAQPVTIFVYGPVTILGHHYIANSSWHWGSYGSIWTGPSPQKYYMDRWWRTGPYTAIWPEVILSHYAVSWW